MSTAVMTRKPPLELRILQLYIWALAAPKWVRQTASLARHGAYEVRLIDPSQRPRSDSIPFWIEMFDHKTKTSLDSYGGYDLEETAAAAERLICQAKRLYRDSNRG